jgi:hypothetical protein
VTAWGGEHRQAQRPQMVADALTATSNAASASSNRDADGATRYDKHARHYAGATTWPRY